MTSPNDVYNPPKFSRSFFFPSVSVLSSSKTSMGARGRKIGYTTSKGSHFFIDDRHFVLLVDRNEINSASMHNPLASEQNSTLGHAFLTGLVVFRQEMVVLHGYYCFKKQADVQTHPRKQQKDAVNKKEGSPCSTRCTYLVAH